MARRETVKTLFPVLSPFASQTSVSRLRRSIDRFLIEESLASEEHSHQTSRKISNETKRNSMHRYQFLSIRIKYCSSDLSKGAETVNFVGRVMGNEKLIGSRASATKAIATRHERNNRRKTRGGRDWGERERESSSHGSHKEAANLFIIAPRK